MDVFQMLLEGGSLSDEVKTSLNEAWQKKVKEIKEQAQEEIREEFAQKYEHDKKSIVEGMGALINDEVQLLTKKFKLEERKLAEANVSKRKNIQKFMEFSTKKLAEEISDLHEDRAVLAKNMELFQEFFMKTVEKELNEFKEQNHQLAEATVKIRTEGKSKIEEAKREFNKKAAEKA